MLVCYTYSVFKATCDTVRLKGVSGCHRDVLAPEKITILTKNNGRAKQLARIREQSNQGPL